MRIKLFSVTLLFLFNHFFTVAQTLDKLDLTNGFKKFKFGLSPSQFSNLQEEKKVQIKLKDVKNYNYIGDDITDFHGVKVESIHLSFYKNRLYKVNVNFGSLFKEYTISEHSMVQYGLTANYGTINHDCNETQTTDMTVTNCTIWDGRKVRLEHIRINLLRTSEQKNERYNYIQGYILFTDKKIQQIQQDSELD